jgi:hypothetical protein
MVDLSTLQGSSLVPIVSKDFQKGIQEIFQDANERRNVEEIAQGGQTEQQERASLLRLNQLDPVLAQGVQGVLQRRDDQETAALQQQTDDAFKFSTFIGGIKDFFKQGQAIDTRIAELQQDPNANPQRIENLLKLKNMTPAQREMAILKTKTMTGDVKTVIQAEKAKAKKAEEAQQQKFVENALAAQNVEAAEVKDQVPLLEDLAFQAERDNNSAGAQVWRDISELPAGPRRDQALRQIQGLAATKITPTAAVEAKTDQAKLNQDLRNGLITQKQFIQQSQILAAKGQSSLIGNLKAAGIKFDDAGRVISDDDKKLIIDILKKPQVSIKEGIKLTPDFVPVNQEEWDRGDHSSGIKALKGSKADRLGISDAAKVEMVQVAIKAAGKAGDPRGIDGLVYETEIDANGNLVLIRDADGNLNVDRTTLAASFAGLPGTDGQLLNVKMEMGIQAITRGETGAAMPPSEVENTRIRFMPKITDSAAVIQVKLEMFREFLNGSLKLVDPTATRFTVDNKDFVAGAFNEQAYENEFQTRIRDQSRKKKLKIFNQKSGRVE